MTSTGDDGRTLLTPGEIARMAGVGASAVSNWRKRADDFPDPVARTGHVDLFDLTEVMDWLRATGKVASDQDSSLDTFLFQQADRLRDLGTGEALAAILSLLAAVRRAHAAGDDPATWDDLPADEVQRRLTAAARDAARDSDLAGIDPGVEWLPRLIPGFRDLVDLYSKATEPDRLAGTIVDRYMSRFGRTYETEHYTTPVLRRTVAALAWAPDSARRRVLDPACGMGGLLAATVIEADAEGVEVYGAEINLTAARIARARFAAAGTPVLISAGNTLAHDPFPNLAADAVVCDPPWGLRARDQQIAPSLAAHLGRGGQPSLDLAWSYYAVDHLSALGRAVVLTNPGALFRGGSDALARFELLRRGCVHAVVALPADPGARTSLAPVALVLRSPSSPDRGRDVLFLDAADPQVWALDGDAPDLDRLVTLVNDPRHRDHLTPAQADTVATTPVLDLLAPGETLNPARWLNARPIDTEARRRDVEERTSKLAALYEFMDNFVYNPIAPEATEPPRMMTIGELVDSGAIRLHRAPTIQRNEFSDDGIEVLTTTSVTRPDADDAPGHVPADHPKAAKARLTKPWDIVFAPIGAKAIVDSTGGHLPVSPLLVIEMTGDWFMSPAVLAALLSSPTTAALGHGSTIPRVDVLQVPIPMLTEEQCERLERALSNLEHGAHAARVFADAAEATRQSIVEAAYAGVLPQ